MQPAPPEPGRPQTAAPARCGSQDHVIQLNGRIGVTVTVRWIPLVSAPYGTRVARPAERRCSQVTATAPARPRVRPVPGDHHVVDNSPEGSRQPWVGRLELRPTSRSVACSRPHPVVDLRVLATRCDRWRPLRSPGRRSGVYPACTAGSGSVQDLTRAPGSGRAHHAAVHDLPVVGQGLVKPSRVAGPGLQQRSGLRDHLAA
jgi:hypothetical protein